MTLDVYRQCCYGSSKILGYRDKLTHDFAAGKRVKAFQGFARQAHLTLRVLDLARTLRTLSSIPGNHFETLKGDRKDQYSIRINRQWRVCFQWQDGAAGPSQVEIVDYH